ncbi:hypothetical protein DL89DRAFT_16783 [Linderina pennispora]|uniref:Uncharacterized protein n=1 Tax=Linderina pennispora TaxID=61395 RepID=A0A1Y1WM69_9FUNG|nr:uncharacterized protein DL89DRAFT_16783 [Linderina pennispora]ORX74465.1 hypothetical protein DL89DRAFT_16783 [Linderina pennispora]
MYPAVISWRPDDPPCAVQSSHTHGQNNTPADTIPLRGTALAKQRAMDRTRLKIERSLIANVWTMRECRMLASAPGVFCSGITLSITRIGIMDSSGSRYTGLQAAC